MEGRPRQSLAAEALEIAVWFFASAEIVAAVVLGIPLAPMVASVASGARSGVVVDVHPLWAIARVDRRSAGMCHLRNHASIVAG